MKKLAALVLAILALAGVSQVAMATAGTHVFFGEWVEFEEGGFMLYLPDTWNGMDLTELLSAEKREKVDVMSIYGDAPMVFTVNIMCWSDMITEDMPMEQIESSIELGGEYEGTVGEINGSRAIFYEDIGDDLMCVYIAYGDKLISIAGGPVSDASYRPMFAQMVNSFTPMAAGHRAQSRQYTESRP